MRRVIMLVLLCVQAQIHCAVHEADERFGSDGSMAIRAFLDDSIPDFAGIVVLSTGINGDYRNAVDLMHWRTLCAGWKMVLVGTSIQGGAYGDCSKGSGQALVNCIKSISDQSKHAELAAAPIALCGFSQGGAFSYSFAWWMPKRTMAFVNGKSGFAKDGDSNGFEHVPGLFVFSENDHPSVLPRMSTLMKNHQAQSPPWMLVEDWGFRHEPGRLEPMAAVFFNSIFSGNGVLGKSAKEVAHVWGGPPSVYGNKLVPVAKTRTDGNGGELSSCIPGELTCVWQGYVTSSPIGRVVLPREFAVTSNGGDGVNIAVEDIPAEVESIDVCDFSASILRGFTARNGQLKTIAKFPPGLHALSLRYSIGGRVVGCSRPTIFIVGR